MAGITQQQMEDFREQASLAVADAMVDSVHAQRAMGRDIPRKFPPPVVRAVILIQACLRRKAFLRSFGALEDDEELKELAPPPPLTAVALYMCRRMRNPKFVDVEREAGIVAGCVCAKDKGITMDVVAEVVWFYEGSIPDDHYALITLSEKLQKLVIDAHETLQDVLGRCETPAEVRAAVDNARRTFQVLPELESQVFSCAGKAMEDVTLKADQHVKQMITKSVTTLEYKECERELERIYGPVETHLREELEVACLRRVQFLEMELETRWSRPFAGPLPPHSRASRRYVLELGLVPSVEAFLKEEKSHAAKLEAQFEVQVLHQQAEVRKLTAKRKEARTRFVIQDLDNKIVSASSALQRAIEEALVNLGPDSALVTRRARELLSPEAHRAVFAMFAEQTAEELQQEIESGDTSPEAADRRRGVASALADALSQLSPNHPYQEQLREQYSEELAAVADNRQEPDDEPPCDDSIREAAAAKAAEEERAAAAERERVAAEKAAAEKAAVEAKEAAKKVEADREAIRAKLRPQKVREIRKLAADLGATEDEIDNADEADKPKSALIELVVNLKERHPVAPASPAASATAAGTLEAAPAQLATAASEPAEAASAADPQLRQGRRRGNTPPPSGKLSGSEDTPVQLENAARQPAGVDVAAEPQLGSPPGGKPSGFLSALEAAGESSNLPRGDPERQTGPTAAWMGPADQQSRDLPGLAQKPLHSPGHSTVDEPEDEDDWGLPAGFEPVESKSEEVVAPEKFKLPGVDIPLSRAEEGESTAMDHHKIDPQALMMLQSFDAESLLKEKNAIPPSGIMVKLTLKDLNIDVVKLHTEAVFKQKFTRALAEAANIPKERIQVQGFEEGSVVVLFHIKEPLPGETAPVPEGNRIRGAPTGPKSAEGVYDDLRKQVNDGSSKLRLGEVGPFVSNATLERGVSTIGSKVLQGSLDTAFVAPPISDKKPGNTSDRNLAWTGSTAAGDTLARGPGMGTTAMTWGAATGAPTMGLSQNPTSQTGGMFRTTCPNDDKDTAGWTAPYAQQGLYTFYDTKPEEVHPAPIHEAPLSTKPQKQKFKMHASFCLTRHPVKGTDAFKDLPVPQSPTIAAAASWLENAEAELRDPGLGSVGAKKTEWPDFKELGLKSKIGKALAEKKEAEEAGDPDGSPGSPLSASGGTPAAGAKKTGKKPGKKPKADMDSASGTMPEPEPEASAADPVSPAASARGGGSAKRGGRRDETPTASVSPSPESPGNKGRKSGAKTPTSGTEDVGGTAVADPISDPDTSDPGSPTRPASGKKGKKAAGKKDAKNLKVVVEDSGAKKDAASPRSPSVEDRAGRASPAVSEKQSLAERRKGAGGMSELRPPAVDTKTAGGRGPLSPKSPAVSKTPKAPAQGRALSADGSQAASPSDSKDSNIQNSRYVGMLGGIPNTGVRAQADGNNRLPALVGKPSTDDLRSPAFMYNWYRHETVSIGPPYKLSEGEGHEESPQWSAMQLLDASLDRNDWRRSYSYATRRVGRARQDWSIRGGSLGPSTSIRGVGRATSAGAAPKHLPPVGRRPRRGLDRKKDFQPHQAWPQMPRHPSRESLEPHHSDKPPMVEISPPSTADKDGTVVADPIDMSEVPPEAPTGEKDDSAAVADSEPSGRRKSNRERVSLRKPTEDTGPSEDEARKAKEEADKQAKEEAKQKKKKEKSEQKNKEAKDKIKEDKKREKEERKRKEEEDARKAAEITPEEAKKREAAEYARKMAEDSKKEKKKKTAERDHGEAPSDEGLDMSKLKEVTAASADHVLHQEKIQDPTPSAPSAASAPSDAAPEPARNASKSPSGSAQGKARPKDKGKKGKKKGKGARDAESPSSATASSARADEEAKKTKEEEAAKAEAEAKALAEAEEAKRREEEASEAAARAAEEEAAAKEAATKEADEAEGAAEEDAVAKEVRTSLADLKAGGLGDALANLAKPEATPAAGTAVADAIDVSDLPGPTRDDEDLSPVANQRHSSMVAPGTIIPEEDDTKTMISRPWSSASGSRASHASGTPAPKESFVADSIAVDEDGVNVKVNLNLLVGDQPVEPATQVIPTEGRIEGTGVADAIEEHDLPGREQEVDRPGVAKTTERPGLPSPSRRESEHDEEPVLLKEVHHGPVASDIAEERELPAARQEVDRPEVAKTTEEPRFPSIRAEEDTPVEPEEGQLFAQSVDDGIEMPESPSAPRSARKEADMPKLEVAKPTEERRFPSMRSEDDTPVEPEERQLLVNVFDDGMERPEARSAPRTAREEVDKPEVPEVANATEERRFPSIRAEDDTPVEPEERALLDQWSEDGTKEPESRTPRGEIDSPLVAKTTEELGLPNGREEERLLPIIQEEDDRPVEPGEPGDEGDKPTGVDRKELSQAPGGTAIADAIDPSEVKKPAEAPVRPAEADEPIAPVRPAEEDEPLAPISPAGGDDERLKAIVAERDALVRENEELRKKMQETSQRELPSTAAGLGEEEEVERIGPRSSMLIADLRHPYMVSPGDIIPEDDETKTVPSRPWSTGSGSQASRPSRPSRPTSAMDLPDSSMVAPGTTLPEDDDTKTVPSRPWSTGSGSQASRAPKEHGTAVADAISMGEAEADGNRTPASRLQSARPSIIITEQEPTGGEQQEAPRQPFIHSPSVAAWLYSKPAKVHVDDVTAPDSVAAQDPSMEAWLRSAPPEALPILRQVTPDDEVPGTTPADATDLDTAPVGDDSPSVSSWLQSAPPAVRETLDRLSEHDSPMDTTPAAPTDTTPPEVEAPLAETKAPSAPSSARQPGRRTSELDVAGATPEEEGAYEEPARLDFVHSPSVGAWLRSAPARGYLAAALSSVQEATPPAGTAVADAIDASDLPRPRQDDEVVEPASVRRLTMDLIARAEDNADARNRYTSEILAGPLTRLVVRRVLERRIAEKRDRKPDTAVSRDLPPAAPPSAPRPEVSGDFRKGPRDSWAALHEPFRVERERSRSPKRTPRTPTPRSPKRSTPRSAIDTEDERDGSPEIGTGRRRDSPPARTDSPPARPAVRPAESVAPARPIATTGGLPSDLAASRHMRTNAGATRQQVLSFAQSMTASIFRNSNNLAMQRAASTPQLRRFGASTMGAGLGMPQRAMSPPTPAAQFMGMTPIVAPRRETSPQSPSAQGFRFQQGSVADRTSGSASPPPAAGQSRTGNLPRREGRRPEPIPTEDDAFFF